MQIVTLLLIIIAILTALSGIAVLSGADRRNKLRAFLFFFATMAALGWTTGIGRI